MEAKIREGVFSVPKTILEFGDRFDYTIYRKVDNRKFRVLVDKDSIYNKAKCTFYSKDELKKVFIHIKDKIKYQNDMQKHISSIIDDESICLNVKASLLNDIAKETINTLFKAEITVESLEKADNIITNSINLILSDESAMRSMLKVASFDYYTSTHCIDVSTYAIAFGKFLGLSTTELKLLGKAALLHDIGKKDINKDIICKNGKLTYDEFEEVKNHPTFSAQILRECGEYDERLLNIVEQHHEKCDGTGYPKGLKKDEIDDFAKIVAICDIFHALTTRRTYKNEMGKSEAIMLMYETMSSGICLDYLRKFVKFLNSY